MDLFIKVVLTINGFVSVVNGAWSTWGDWSGCSVTCGYGVNSRTRTCLSKPCIGPHEMHVSCELQKCASKSPGDTTWSVWGDWSACSQTCGGGTRTRDRTCGTGHVTDCCVHQESEACRLEYVQSRECVNEDCYGSWSDWGPWHSCSATCGEGVQSRSRGCEPQGAVCKGRGDQSRSCYVQCPVSDNLLDDSDENQTCSQNNPCRNGGVCESTGGHMHCTCLGDWRGAVCNSMCLMPTDLSTCSNKAGLFHDCTDCSRFVICTSGRLISMPCVPGRIWTGNGCNAPEKTKTVCINSAG